MKTAPFQTWETAPAGGRCMVHFLRRANAMQASRTSSVQAWVHACLIVMFPECTKPNCISHAIGGASEWGVMNARGAHLRAFQAQTGNRSCCCLASENPRQESISQATCKQGSLAKTRGKNPRRLIKILGKRVKIGTRPDVRRRPRLRQTDTHTHTHTERQYRYACVPYL